ncbi:alpha/beta hydrolase [Sphingomonas sabuli]|uniref:Alpha/beta hydrolase n=1 Tax=Sphingomonas sabuli TaxID=2764186 RepID=A0A7G9L0K8_9SPHN|nr:alpha/beta hydrolase [Sphingomonas sabuli]QNM82157.1 alpha/beta hydrolase [Sphingomonas sabuli]
MTGFVERSWASRDGLRLHARDYAGASGDCRLPVLCLHGLTRNSRDFEELAPRLAQGGRRVIVPDTRGRGLSQWDPDPENYAPKVYARDVLALMDGLGIARAVFIGTSMGGLITMTLAALRSRAIAAAVLNDVGPEVGQAGLDRILSYAGKSVEIRTWQDAADYIRSINAVAFPEYGAEDWDVFARRTFREKDGKPVLDYDPAIAIPMMKGQVKNRSLIASLLFRRLARRRPTLLVRGALSDLNPDAVAERMMKAAPSMQVAVVPGVGHAPTLSEPVAAKAIDDFLASVP